MDKEIEMMLKEQIIEPFTSEWASPMVIIKKKDNTIRLCVDYQRLNAETYLDAYPMPPVLMTSWMKWAKQSLFLH